MNARIKRLQEELTAHVAALKAEMAKLAAELVSAEKDLAEISAFVAYSDSIPPI